jgi:hypothetical protein
MAHIHSWRAARQSFVIWIMTHMLPSVTRGILWLVCGPLMFHLMYHLRLLGLTMNNSNFYSITGRCIVKIYPNILLMLLPSNMQQFFIIVSLFTFATTCFGLLYGHLQVGTYQLLAVTLICWATCRLLCRSPTKSVSGFVKFHETVHTLSGFHWQGVTRTRKHKQHTKMRKTGIRQDPESD